MDTLLYNVTLQFKMKLEIKRKKITEANIQAEFYHQCRLLKIPCYLEFKFGNSRFDAVIYRPKTYEILIIIEVKNYIKPKKEYNTLQFYKYKKYNLPIIVINNVDSIKESILQVLRILWKNAESVEEKIKIEKQALECKNYSDKTLKNLDTWLVSRYLTKKEKEKYERNKST